MDDIRKYMEIVDHNSVDHRTEALTELRRLDEAPALLSLIGTILGSAVRLAQLGFWTIGKVSSGGSAMTKGGGWIASAISIIFDGIRLGSDAGAYITKHLANLLGGPGKNMKMFQSQYSEDMYDTDKPQAQKQVDDHNEKIRLRDAELKKIKDAVNKFTSMDGFDSNSITQDLEDKMAKLFGNKLK